jgi:hypothetical protein
MMKATATAITARSRIIAVHLDATFVLTGGIGERDTTPSIYSLRPFGEKVPKK